MTTRTGPTVHAYPCKHNVRSTDRPTMYLPGPMPLFTHPDIHIMHSNPDMPTIHSHKQIHCAFIHGQVHCSLTRTAPQYIHTWPDLLCIHIRTGPVSIHSRTDPPCILSREGPLHSGLRQAQGCFTYIRRSTEDTHVTHPLCTQTRTCPLWPRCQTKQYTSTASTHTR